MSDQELHNTLTNRLLKTYFPDVLSFNPLFSRAFGALPIQRIHGTSWQEWEFKVAVALVSAGCLKEDLQFKVLLTSPDDIDSPCR